MVVASMSSLLEMVFLTWRRALLQRYHRSGLYARETPFVLGQEASGIVEIATPEAAAAGFSAGTPVTYSVLGTYCEFTRVSAANLLAVPDGLDMAVACTLPVQVG